MDLNAYQTAALATAVYPREHAIVYPAMLLNEEAGEVAGKVAKVLRGDWKMTDSAMRAIGLEASDCLWALAALAHDLGYTLEQIAAVNLDKLAARAAAGTIRGQGDSR